MAGYSEKQQGRSSTVFTLVSTASGEVYSAGHVDPEGDYMKLRKKREEQQKVAQEKHRQWLKERGIK